MHNSNSRNKLFIGVVFLSIISFFYLGFIEKLQANAIQVMGVASEWTQTNDSTDWAPSVATPVLLEFDSKLWFLSYGSGSIFQAWNSEDGVTWNEVINVNNPPDFTAIYLTFDNKLWAIGSGGATSPVWYSEDGITWTEATSAPDWDARTQQSAAVFDNKMWILGGLSQDSVHLNDVWYSEDGITWTEATSAAGWSPRRYDSATVFDNKMWILGGEDSSFEGLNDVWYSEDGVTWTEATSAAGWSPRYELAATTYDNQLWVADGRGPSQEHLNDVWSTALPEIPTDVNQGIAEVGNLVGNQNSDKLADTGQPHENLQQFALLVVVCGVVLTLGIRAGQSSRS